MGTWSSGGNLNTGRDMLSGGGSPSDAICMGGYNYDITYDDLTATEEYNGSSWSSGGDMSMGRAAAAGGGSSSDAICMGGYGDTSTEEYNGTSWSSGGTLNTGRYAMGGAGNSSNAICMGGYTYDEETEEEANVPYTEEYNGTSWSSGGDLATARYYPASGGNASNAICMGGYAD